jgi:hypothetical protein
VNHKKKHYSSLNVSSNFACVATPGLKAGFIHNEKNCSLNIGWWYLLKAKAATSKLISQLTLLLQE